MTDDLRTRIAFAIQLRWTQLAYDSFVSPSWDKDCLALADAVIRELGMKKVIDVNRSVPQSRYVTDWIPN